MRRKRVTNQTRAIYNGWTAHFEAFAGQTCQSFTTDALDKQLDRYLVHLYKSGESADSARFALYGVAFNCCLATRSPEVLPLAKASLLGFSKTDVRSHAATPAMNMMTTQRRNRIRNSTRASTLAPASRRRTFVCGY